MNEKLASQTSFPQVRQKRALKSYSLFILVVLILFSDILSYNTNCLKYKIQCPKSTTLIMIDQIRYG